MQQAITWVKLADIMLNEISSTQKNTWHDSSVTGKSMSTAKVGQGVSGTGVETQGKEF